MDRVLAPAVGIEHERGQQPVGCRAACAASASSESSSSSTSGLTSTATGSDTSASPRLLARPKPAFSPSATTTASANVRATATVSSREAQSTTTVRTPGRWRAADASSPPRCAAELCVTVTSAKSPRGGRAVAGTRAG